MGTKSRSLIDDNCKQDLLEDKENISNIAFIRGSKRKYPQKCSEKSLNKYVSAKNLMNMKPKKLSKSVEEKQLKAKSSNKGIKKQIISNQCDNSINVSKSLTIAEKLRRPLKSSASTQNTKLDLEKQDLSESQNNQSVNKFCTSLEMKEAVVVLKDIEKETVHQKSYDCLKIEAKDITSKSDNCLPECECHSTLTIKEAVVVLERYEDIQKKAAIVKSYGHSSVIIKDDGNAKKAAGKNTKRKREEKTENEDEASSNTKKSKKQKDSAQSKKSKKDDIPDVSALDFNNDSKSQSGNLWNFKISSWNVNGIRAWLEKNGLSYLHHEQPDILCIQETKCSDDKLPDEVKNIEGYHVYWLSGDKEGYSGVGLITKEKPINVEYGIGISEHDNEGRVITAEYEKFYLVSSYVPNAGRGLVRLKYRMQWDKDFRDYLKKLDSKKPVILCGDLNVAHEEIDLANPKTNKKNAGFTKEEREGFSALLKEGFIDSFRQLYPDLKGAYTFWTYMMNARAKNVGWRLDYFVMSERFTDNLCDNVIRKDVFGSDHCPITLFLSL